MESEYELAHAECDLLAGRLALEESLNPQEIQSGIERLGPWFYPFNFGGGGFQRVERVRPHEGAYEQHARGKRVANAAWN
jgi:hypothetical protein